MTSIFKYKDGSESFKIKTGDTFLVQQDCDGFWGYTSKKGYNSWENSDLPKTKSEAVRRLRELEKSEVLEAKYSES